MESHYVTKPTISTKVSYLKKKIFFFQRKLRFVCDNVTGTETLVRLWRAVSELWRREKVGAFNPPPASRELRIHATPYIFFYHLGFTESSLGARNFSWNEGTIVQIHIT